MGKVELFAVYFEGNKRTFYPGEIINGTAFLKTNKELKLRGVRIEFHGQAKVRWSETSGSGKSHRHHSHSNQENFIDTAATLYGKGESKVPLLGSYSWERGCWKPLLCRYKIFNICESLVSTQTALPSTSASCTGLNYSLDSRHQFSLDELKRNTSSQTNSIILQQLYSCSRGGGRVWVYSISLWT